MLLAVDTATRIMSLALHDGASLLAEQTWHIGNQHTTQLAPSVQLMLEHCGVLAHDLTALGVSIGPGSYTGLRIGVALAKGMAASLNLPVVGVSTLDTLAVGQPNYQSGAGLIAVVQAGRGRIIVKSYRWRKGGWSSHAEPQLMDWKTLLASIDGPAYLTGEIDDAGFGMVAEARKREMAVSIAPPAHRLRRAGFLAEAAWQQLREAQDASVFNASRLAPFYIKSDDET